MEAVILTIQELDLPFSMDKTTLGDGNCFFTACCQQLSARPELKVQQIKPSILRFNVCKFAQSSRKKTVLEMKNNFNDLLNNDWNDFFEKMKLVGTWADGPAAQITALYLERDMIIISSQCNSQNPWLMINRSKKQDFPPIVLGNTPTNHFQSFLPHDDFIHCSLTSIQKEFEKKDGQNRIKEDEKTTFEFEKKDGGGNRINEDKKATYTNQLLSTPKCPTRPVKKKHMSFKEVSKMGNYAIQAIQTLMRENRRLQAPNNTLRIRLEAVLGDINDEKPKPVDTLRIRLDSDDNEVEMTDELEMTDEGKNYFDTNDIDDESLMAMPM